MWKAGRTGFCLAIVLAASAVAVHAQGTDGTDDFSFLTLSGIRAITVQVDGVHPDFTRYGLDAQRLKSATEARLAENGITVVALGEAQRLPDAVLMKIKLAANEDQVKLYFFGLSIDLRQKVPVNPAGGFVSRSLWSRGRTGVIAPTDLGRINTYTADLVTAFLADFRAQNRAATSAPD